MPLWSTQEQCYFPLLVTYTVIPWWSELWWFRSPDGLASFQLKLSLFLGDLVSDLDHLGKSERIHTLRHVAWIKKEEVFNFYLRLLQ